MLSNEIFALACRAYYDEEGIVVDASNGQFAHCPLPERYGDKGYYLLWEHHQHQGLLQSRDIGECCFFAPDTLRWLKECDYWPDNYFGLWDIYTEYSSMLARKNCEELHRAKDETGRSLHTLRLHREKDENGKSLLGLRNAERLHAEKNEEGKSIQGLKNAERLHAEKNEEGKSVNSLKGSRKAHSRKTESGKSVTAVTAAQALHRKKSEDGKSLQALKLHEKKDENGKSLHTLKINSQVWESMIDGFRSNAGAVAYHNKANGWDPAARVRISW